MTLESTLVFWDGRTESRPRSEPQSVPVKAFRVASVTFVIHPESSRAVHISVLSGDPGAREMRGQRGLVIPESDPRWAQMMAFRGLGEILKDAVQGAARDEGILPPANDTVETP